MINFIFKIKKFCSGPEYSIAFFIIYNLLFFYTGSDLYKLFFYTGPDLYKFIIYFLLFFYTGPDLYKFIIYFLLFFYTGPDLYKLFLKLFIFLFYFLIFFYYIISRSRISSYRISSSRKIYNNFYSD
jgi:hypothetical protein